MLPPSTTTSETSRSIVSKSNSLITRETFAASFSTGTTISVCNARPFRRGTHRNPPAIVQSCGPAALRSDSGRSMGPGDAQSYC